MTISSTPATIRPIIRRLVGLVCVAVLTAAIGCSRAEPPGFVLNMEGRDPDTVSTVQAETIRQTLEQLFGTPDEPCAGETELDPEKLRLAAGPMGRDAEGVSRGLFRQHCVECHGISGDGLGPAAALLNPWPRDFRNGIFKYTSTADGHKPVRADLQRTLLRGVPGTAMPSFAMLRQHEIDALLEYVKYLSIRGDVELFLFQEIVEGGQRRADALDVADWIEGTVDQWADAENAVIVPPPKPPLDTPEQRAASLARGAELYAPDSQQSILDEETRCAKCHGPEGMGDGTETELYDDWNKRKKGVNEDETARKAAWFTLPIQQIRPRNLQEGIFRGGSGDNDLYWRIRAGIKGTPMPALEPSGDVSPEDIWDLVYFIRSL